MAQELISKRTRTEFREFLVGWTLAEIQIEFESVGIAADTNYVPSESGQRRSYVEQFYHSLDFTKPADVKRLLSAYVNILRGAAQKADKLATQSFGGPSQAETMRKAAASLVEWLKGDGYVYNDGCITPVDPRRLTEPRTLSQATRRTVFDFFALREVDWSGRLEHSEFLGRLYDLSKLPSRDPRFKTASGDIYKHTDLNQDWEPDWVLTDDRFDLLHAEDETFLQFLAEAVHPGVRSDEKETAELVAELNKLLGTDGWCLAKAGELSGRPLYRGERSAAGPDLAPLEALARTLDAGYMARQVNRMRAAAATDPDLAIGTAKEFIETVCKTILTEHNAAPGKDDDVPRLIKSVAKQLNLTPEGVPDSARGAEIIRGLLGNLATVAVRLAELRNIYGTGHGKHAKSTGLSQRHAKLAVGAATALAVFLFETNEHRKAGPPRV